jgi:hypothetical protein
MLAEQNLKLIKVGGGSSGGVGIGSKSPASGTLISGSSGTPGAKLAAAVSHATPSKVSPSAPVGMMAALVADVDEDSSDSFCWDGDEDGVTFEDAHKPKHWFPPTHLPPLALCVAMFLWNRISPVPRAWLPNWATTSSFLKP